MEARRLTNEQKPTVTADSKKRLVYGAVSEKGLVYGVDSEALYMEYILLGASGANKNDDKIGYYRVDEEAIHDDSFIERIKNSNIAKFWFSRAVNPVVYGETKDGREIMAYEMDPVSKDIYCGTEIKENVARHMSNYLSNIKDTNTKYKNGKILAYSSGCLALMPSDGSAMTLEEYKKESMMMQEHNSGEKPKVMGKVVPFPCKK